MDAFFVSVELLDRPELRGKPVVVGGQPDQRGIVSTASYEARKYGIHSAMPLRTAGRLCPHAIFLEPRHHLYSEWSDRVAAILGKYSPVVEMASVDEAYLDLAGTETPARAAARGRGCVAARNYGDDRTAVFRGPRANAPRRQSGERSGQAARSGLGSRRKRGSVSRAAGRAAHSRNRQSHRSGAQSGGDRKGRTACRGRARKTRAGFRPLGHGALPQSARRRHLRIFRGCRAEIHFAQPHVFRGHAGPRRCSTRRSACFARKR